MKRRLPLHLRSPLVPLGQALVLCGFLAGFVRDFAHHLAQGPVRDALSLLPDLLRLCFVAGVVCLVAGWRRNRRVALQRRASAAPPA